MEHLTEPGIRSHFKETFEQCKAYKMVYYTRLVNVCLFIFFVLCLGMILYYKKKGKLTPQQKNKKNEQDRLYIIQKIRSLQVDKNGLLTK